VTRDDFKKRVALAALSGFSDEEIAETLGETVDAVRVAREENERWSRENPPPRMPRNWPTGPYSDAELQSAADYLGVEMETVREQFPGASREPDDTR
jgi:hypothetical protein